MIVSSKWSRPPSSRRFASFSNNGRQPRRWRSRRWGRERLERWVRRWLPAWHPGAAPDTNAPVLLPIEAGPRE
jgi:hypothetical protein